MKAIGVFSDIHGNRQAFAAIERVIRARRDLTWLCLGDIVGWFFRPVECVLKLKQLLDEGLVDAIVPGNHDLMALGRFADRPDMTDRMLATAFSAGQLEGCPEARDFLASLERHTLQGETWIAAHHSPFNMPRAAEPLDASLYGGIEADLPDQLPAWAGCEKPVVLTGHGHAPRLYALPVGVSAPRMQDVETSQPPRDDPRLTVAISAQRRYWVRNGTVGGPHRETIAAALWTEYQPGERLTFHRELYDTAELREDIRLHAGIMANRETWQKRVMPLLR